MDNFGSVVRMVSAPPRRILGKFCTANRIQKLTAPARELIQSTNTLRRFLDFLVRWHNTGVQELRSLKPKFLEYWREACEFIEEEILARFGVSGQTGFQRSQFVEIKKVFTRTWARIPKPKYSHGPPKGFVPLPDAEIGGCARNDSLIALYFIRGRLFLCSEFLTKSRHQKTAAFD